MSEKTPLYNLTHCSNFQPRNSSSILFNSTQQDPTRRKKRHLLKKKESFRTFFSKHFAMWSRAIHEFLLIKSFNHDKSVILIESYMV